MYNFFSGGILFLSAIKHKVQQLLRFFVISNLVLGKKLLVFFVKILHYDDHCPYSFSNFVRGCLFVCMCLREIESVKPIC